jgi:ankyrin repeat protein
MEKNSINPQDNENFLEACKKNDESRLTKLLKNGADPLYTDSYQNNCLHISKKAALSGVLISFIKQLPDAPIPFSQFINAMNQQGRTPLHNAVEELNFERITLLLEHGAIADHPDNTGETPFHLIVRKKRLFSEKNDFSDMPKQILTEDLRYKVLEILCKFGGKINKPNLLQDTPLHVALSQDSVKPDLIKDLLVLGAQLTCTNNQGKTPLSLACELKNYEKFFEGLFTDVELPDKHNLLDQQKISSLTELSFRQLFFLTCSVLGSSSEHINLKKKSLKAIMQQVIKNFYSQQNNESLSTVFAEYVPTREIGTIYKALTIACKKYLKKDEATYSLTNIQLLLYQTVNTKCAAVKQRWINALEESKDKESIPQEIKKTLIAQLIQIIRPELIAYQNNFLEQYLTLRIQELSLLLERINQGMTLAKNLEVIQYEPRLKQIGITIENSLKLIKEALMCVKKKKSSEEFAKTYILPEHLEQYNNEVGYTLKFLEKIKRIYKMNQKLFTIIKITEILDLQLFIPFIKETSILLKQKVEEYHHEFKQKDTDSRSYKSVMSEEEIIDLYKEIKTTLNDLLFLLNDEEIAQLQNYFRSKNKSVIRQ